MELYSIYPPPSPVKRPLPPDVNKDGLITNVGWGSRLAIPSPMIYLVHGIIAIPLLILSIFFAVHRHGVIKHPEPFWSLFPEFLTMVIVIAVTAFVQFSVLPAFWRNRAKELIADGGFESAYSKSGNRRIVLQVGCSTGETSAIFAQAIIDRQRDISNLSGPSASFPIFIGYDKWSKLTRIPNHPSLFLTTMTKVGVPRECIIANRVADPSSVESRTTLPYSDNSISLIICNFGLTEICKWSQPKERPVLFRELARVLEPGGRMIVVESEGPSKSALRIVPKAKISIFRGAMFLYKVLLIEELGWPAEMVTTKWHSTLQYLVAVKPANGYGRETV